MSEGNRIITIAGLITVEELQKLAAGIPDKIPKDTLLTVTFDDHRITLKNAEGVIISHIKWSAGFKLPVDY